MYLAHTVPCEGASAVRNISLVVVSKSIVDKLLAELYTIREITYLLVSKYPCLWKLIPVTLLLNETLRWKH